MKEKKINSYSDLISLRKHDGNMDTDVASIVGTIFGVISVLKKFVSGQL